MSALFWASGRKAPPIKYASKNNAERKEARLPNLNIELFFI
jgi:hypothetical protein